MKRSLPSIIAGLVLVLILGLYMVTYQVRSTQVAVISTFGNADKTAIKGSEEGGAGTRWKWPWPIQSVATYDNRVQTTPITGEETSTADKKTVIVSTAVSWRIAEPYEFSVRCRDMETAEENLRARVRNDQKTVISSYNFSNFVSVRPEELKFDEIEKNLLAVVQKPARDLYGIQVESVRIEKLALPAKVTESVFSAMSKERQALAERYTSEGNSEAERIKKEAESIANTILSFTDMKSAQIVAEGQRAAVEANKTFSKDQPFAIFLLKLEALSKILKERTTIIMDAEQPPIDQLMPELASPAKQAAVPTTRPTENGASNAAAISEFAQQR